MSYDIERRVIYERADEATVLDGIVAVGASKTTIYVEIDGRFSIVATTEKSDMDAGGCACLTIDKEMLAAINAAAK